MDQEANMAAGLTAAEFHASPGVEDWRVTSWGPQACFRSASLSQAAGLLPAVVDAAARFDLSPDVDVRPEAVIVRIPYRGADRIPSQASGLAATISSAARRLDLTPEPTLIQTVDIAVAQHPELDTRPFWATVLGYEPTGDVDAVDPLRRGPQLSFQDIRPARTGRGRTHIDVSVPADQAKARVDAAVSAGGRIVDDSYAPAWWTLASPDNHGVDVAAWTDTYE
ncbi:VOC family protein [Promicromonospora soli]|nr:VOC family protein [Promicromonospora soli]